VGLLRESVVLCCAQWCQMQRTPRDKCLKLMTLESKRCAHNAEVVSSSLTLATIDPARTTDVPRWLLVGKIDDKHWSALITRPEDSIRLISDPAGCDQRCARSAASPNFRNSELSGRRRRRAERTPGLPQNGMRSHFR
jgi:hypothetical protein